MPYSWTYKGSLDKWGAGGKYKLSGTADQCTNDVDYGQICAYKFTPSAGYNLASAASGIGSTKKAHEQIIKQTNSLGGSLSVDF